ncbi:hypothetical phage-related membrane protein [Salmonella bongori NCTC 12419]|uniref:Hypothetical phage-related membrane protein n=1 Tax=Salmonella bongori (strain ATCC 43975 / DSM 13772 / NCTC 12419) TaxID=218493 RepID=A0A0K0H9A8_SALBC|nr:hypothetical phage-related membrane protein [Salmonella bongori NCTC 12419]
MLITDVDGTWFRDKFTSPFSGVPLHISTCKSPSVNTAKARELCLTFQPSLAHKNSDVFCFYRVCTHFPKNSQQITLGLVILFLNSWCWLGTGILSGILPGGEICMKMEYQEGDQELHL